MSLVFRNGVLLHHVPQLHGSYSKLDRTFADAIRLPAIDLTALANREGLNGKGQTNAGQSNSVPGPILDERA